MIKKVETPLDIAYIIRQECKIYRSKGTTMYRIATERFRQMKVMEITNMIIAGNLYYELLEEPMVIG